MTELEREIQEETNVGREEYLRSVVEEQRRCHSSDEEILFIVTKIKDIWKVSKLTIKL